MEKTVLRVEGMSCEHCVKAVTKALEELPGLKDVEVNLKGNTVSFLFDPAKTPLPNIEAAITDAGYEVKG
ncbi:MAG: copper ion binding protein [Spirochaetales bacterium]|jgi:copper chaperone|nr:copper ion binding protein [Spirochaetales bacterium]